MGKSITVCPGGRRTLGSYCLTCPEPVSIREWAGPPSFPAQGGKGRSGEVAGAGAGPPAMLPPAARTRSPVRSLAEPAWQEALLIAAEGPSRVPCRSLSRPCAAPEGLRPGPGLRGLGPRPPVAMPTLGRQGIQRCCCTSTSAHPPRSHRRAARAALWLLSPPRGPSAPGHCLREGGQVGLLRAMLAEARSHVWE